MKKGYLFLGVLLTLFLSVQAMALPVLPSSTEIVFEFNSWEYISNREIDSTSAYALQNGDTMAGVLMLDSLTDGQDEIWGPLNDGGEIAAVFSGLVYESSVIAGGIVISDWSFVDGSTIDIYYDDTPELSDALNASYTTVGAARTAAETAVTNGEKLLQLTWGEYRTITQTGGTSTTNDDTTDSDGHMFFTDDPSWAWNDSFEEGYYEYPSGGTLYDFVYTNVIYAPESQIFMDNANFKTDDDDDPNTPYTNEDYVWDFYNTDDFRGRSVVPEPTTFFLFGCGLLGLAGIGRRRRKN